MTATYFKVLYDAGTGTFSESVPAEEITWAGGGRGLIVLDRVDSATTGQLSVALIAGAIPADGETMTQAVTSAVGVPDGAGETLLYPAYARDDLAVAAAGTITWTGPALGVTHTIYFTETTGPIVNEILTFSPGGQTAEVITDVAVGTADVRFISTVDDLPADTDTFTGDTAASGTQLGVIHDRAYSALHLHRLLADLNDDSDIEGDDDLSMLDPTASERSTDQIVTLKGTIAINDECSQHMYGGSVSQADGATLYSGWDVQVTSPNADTIPVLIAYDETTGAEAVISPQYWGNGYMGDPVAGGIRIMRKTRTNNADIDGRRVRGGLLEFGDTFFFGGTTLGQATTALALFASTDGNNTTAVGTVAGAPYNTIVLTDGYQTIDYNNGNGATPYALELDLGSATKAQAYERTKYVQRRGTAETLYGRDAHLILGVNRNFVYDTESGGPFAENVEIAWGTRINYESEASGPFTVGEVITFSASLAVGRIIFLDDDGTTGVIIMELISGTPADTNVLTGADSGATATVSTSGVTIETATGSGLLLALDDQGTNGNLYYQALYGSAPVDDQAVYGLNGATLVSAAVNVTLASRTINNQFVGNFTGSDFATNFGVGLQAADAEVNDQLRNLLDVVQQPPNNQSGAITAVIAGDSLTAYPWDGTSTDVNGDAEPDFNQMIIATTNVLSAHTSIEVNSIPVSTPAAGFLRMERDSDSNYQLVEYASFSGAVFTLVGTAGADALIANNIFVAYLDVTTATTSESFTAVYGGDQQMALTVRRGGANPIKTFKSTATFGSGGFSVAAVRTTDA